MNFNFASDLHRKGEVYKIEQMEIFAKSLVKGRDMGTAFVTEGYQGYDAFCLIANHPAWRSKEGFVVFNEDSNRPEFIKDGENE